MAVSHKPESCPFILGGLHLLFWWQNCCVLSAKMTPSSTLICAQASCSHRRSSSFSWWPSYRVSPRYGHPQRQSLPSAGLPQTKSVLTCIVSHGIIKGKGLQFPGTNFADRTLPPESTYKTTFLVLSRIWCKICTRAWSPFPLITSCKTMKVSPDFFTTLARSKSGALLSLLQPRGGGIARKPAFRSRSEARNLPRWARI